MSVKPRKIIKKTEPEETKPMEPLHIEAPVIEPKMEEPTPISNTVTVKVLTGTISFKGTHFQHGETFTCTKEDLARFDSKDIEVIA